MFGGSRGGGNAAGGGFNIGNLIKNPFGAFGGGASAFGGLGGFDAPSIATYSSQAGIGGGLHELGQAASAALGGGGFSLSGLGASLGPLAPLLGLTLGASLGGGSLGGSILGGIGGGLVGLSAAALSGVGFAGSAIGGLFGAIPGLSSLGGAIGGVFGGVGSTLGGIAAVAGPIALIAAPLLIGAYLLNRNSQRRKEETIRNDAILEAFAQLDQIKKLIDTHRLDGGQGLADAMTVRANYVTQMSALKDSKTRGHALADVSRLDARIALIRGSALTALDDNNFNSRLLPEFAVGGIVKGMPGSRQLVVAHAGEIFMGMNTSQAMTGQSPSFIPSVGSGSSGGEKEINVEIYLGTGVQNQLVINGQESDRGRRSMAKLINRLAHDNEILAD